MFVLALGVAIFDTHTRLTCLETDASLATLRAAGVDLVHPTMIQNLSRGTNYLAGL